MNIKEETNANGITFSDYMKANPYKLTRCFTAEEWEADMYEHWKSEGVSETAYTPAEIEFMDKAAIGYATGVVMHEGYYTSDAYTFAQALLTARTQFLTRNK